MKRIRIEADVDLKHKRHVQKKAKKLRASESFVVRQMIEQDMKVI